MIFLMGKGGNFRQTVTPQDLAVFQASADRVMAPPTLQRFRGEIAMTEAISRLVHQNRRRVRFTRGHRELTPRPIDVSQPGMAAFVHDLEASGFEVPRESLDLSRVRRVPDDCELLVIAGPEGEFDRDELDVLQDYLLRGGRLLVALGSRRTRVEDVLQEWGVEVGGGSVRLRSSEAESRFESSWVSARAFNPAHSVTAPFEDLGGRFEVRLLAPRPLEPSASPQRLVGERLLSAVNSGERERYYLVGGPGLAGAPRPDGASETFGVEADFVLAAAARQEELSNPPEGWEPLRTRVVVVASASLLRDVQQSGSVRGSFRSLSHRDFIMNCVNWLVGQEELVTRGGGRREVERRVRMSDGIRGFLGYSSLLIFPGVFLCLGAFVYFLRRT